MTNGCQWLTRFVSLKALLQIYLAANFSFDAKILFALG